MIKTIASLKTQEKKKTDVIITYILTVKTWVNGLLTCMFIYMSMFWKQEEEIGALFFFFYSFSSIVPISKISVSCLLLDLISFHVARTLPLTHYISSSHSLCILWHMYTLICTSLNVLEYHQSIRVCSISMRMNKKRKDK
jgi:hypothetical protein